MLGALAVGAALTGLPVFRAAPVSAPAEHGPMVGDPRELEDGLTHLVVAFDDGADTTAPRGGDRDPHPAPDSARDQPAEARSSRRRVPVAEVDGVADADALVALARQGRLLGLERDERSGQLLAVLEVAPGEGSDAPPPSPAAAHEEPAGDVALVGVAPDDPHVVALASVPGTREVEGVGGGWYAVATSGERSAYEALPGVRSVLDDVALSVSADPQLVDQWHLVNSGATVAGLAGVAGADVGAMDAWAVSRGAGVVVAVVDSGMEVTHPDLVANIWSNDDDCGDAVDDDRNGYVDDCRGWDFLNNDNKVDDTGTSRFGFAIDNTHATHVAGIVAATRDNGIGVAGLAPGARIMPVKISDASSMSMSTAATAIRYAVDNGADIVNCSFGTNAGTTLAQVAPLQDAVRYAAQRGVLVVAAAGNDGRDIDAVPTFPASLPEANVLSVGASTNADTRASFSNWGAVGVDLFAPGWSVLSTLPGAGYGRLHGTSMASPVAAGAAALAMAAEPNLGSGQIKDLLMTGSTPIHELAGRSVSGQRLDIGRILNPSGAQREEPASFTFEGFAGATVDAPIDAVIRAAVATSAVPAGARVAYRATLLTRIGDRAFGVSGATVNLGTGSLVTDDHASVPLSPPEGLAPATAARTVPFSLALPAGDYALVAEATSTTDGSPIGRRWAVFFTVVEPGEPVPPVTTAPVSPTTVPSPSSPVGGPAPVPGGGSPSPTTPGPGATMPTGGGSRPGPASPTPSAGAPQVPTTGTAPSPSVVSPPRSSWRWDWWGLPSPWEWTWPPLPAIPDTPWPAPGAPSPAPAPVTAPAPTPTPPTAPQRPSTGSTPGITLPPPPAPVTVGSLTVRSVDPRHGSTQGGTRVRVDGDGFAGTMRVLFGSSPGTGVLVISPTALLVTTPAHAAPGTVDVRVSTSADAAVLRGAFTYVAPTPAGSGSPPAPAGAPGPSPSPVPGPAAPPPTTPSPSPVSGPTTPPPTTPSPTAPTPAPSPDAPADGPVRFTFGDVSGTRGALQLRPVLGRSPLDAHPPATWPARRCVATVCAAAAL